MSVICFWNSGSPVSFGRCHRKMKKRVSASAIALSHVCPRGSIVDNLCKAMPENLKKKKKSVQRHYHKTKNGSII